MDGKQRKVLSKPPPSPCGAKASKATNLPSDSNPDAEKVEKTVYDAEFKFSSGYRPSPPPPRRARSPESDVSVTDKLDKVIGILDRVSSNMDRVSTNLDRVSTNLDRVSTNLDTVSSQLGELVTVQREILVAQKVSIQQMQEIKEVMSQHGRKIDFLLSCLTPASVTVVPAETSPATTSPVAAARVKSHSPLRARSRSLSALGCQPHSTAAKKVTEPGPAVSRGVWKGNEVFDKFDKCAKKKRN